MEKYQENIIPALNQNKVSVFDKEGNDGLKILFVGNSITRHAPKPEVGWLNDCGMAASSIEKDYVHLLMKKIHTLDKDASFQIAQVAGFEWNFLKQLPDEFSAWQKSADYKADIVIMFFGANVDAKYDTDKNPAITFGEAYEKMRNFFATNPNAVFIHSQGFYIRPKLDEEKKAVAEKYGDVFVSLEHIIHRDETHGMFNHPSDLGMQEIADTFWEYIKNIISNLSE